ncbi:pilus assembly FimT family protein [Microaceticoccus formicicus]|uniref:pilus assembly FimT family protein n=1 Tax=Microaceticoccus formicicus TaxID=3118105 RepID=UPI003CD00875|nr:type II secretion system protein [Peptoniphilaceae bacterium AMB_02]
MKRAFTYLELISTIAIIAIVFSIAILKVGAIDEIKERAEFRAIVNDIKYARNLAIVSKSNVEFQVVVTDFNGYKIFQAGEKTNKEVKKVELEKLSRVNTTYYDEQLHFKNDGMPNKGGRIEYKGKKKYYTVTIGVASGKVYIRGER